MKIAIVHASLPSKWRVKEGGVTYFIHNLANQLVERGHEVTLFAMDERPTDAKYQVHTINAAHWLHTNPIARYYLVPWLFARLKLNNFDVVHTNGDDWLMPASRVPRLRTMYGSALAEAQNSVSWKRRLNQHLMYQFEKIAAWRATRTVAISDNTTRYFPQIKQVIGCGVDVNAFRPVKVYKNSVPTILFVGALEGRKRGHLLVEVFLNQIKPQIPDAQLWLVADKAAEGPGIINFGKVSQARLVELYQQAWVFCLPSTYEGFGIPYVEAMAAGTAVVATDNAGSREILDKGRYGVICNDAELGSSLTALLLNPDKRQMLVEAGQKRAENYSWTQITAAYEAVYTELTAKPALKVLAVSHSAVIEVNQQIYQELSKVPNVEVQLITPSEWVSEYSHKRFKTQSLKGLEIPLYKIPVGLAGNNSLHFYWWWPLRRLKVFRPDLIFLDEEPWSIVAFQMVLLSVWLRSKLVFYTKQNLDKRYPLPFSWFNKLTYKVSVKAFSVANEVEMVLRHNGYSKPILYLPHAIDDTAFYARSKPSLLKIELGLADTVVIGYIGRLIEAKGIQVLVKAAALLLQETNLPRWKVLLVGDGVYKETLQRLIAALNLTEHFIFVGAVAHTIVPEYMNCLDIFVLPSLTTPNWKEQFGRVIIEALACGVPVIGSDSGEIPHLIRATGGGLIALEGDETQLAQHLKTLLNDTTVRERLAQKGLAAVQASYTNAGVASRLALLLGQL